MENDWKSPRYFDATVDDEYKCSNCGHLFKKGETVCDSGPQSFFRFVCENCFPETYGV